MEDDLPWEEEEEESFDAAAAADIDAALLMELLEEEQQHGEEEEKEEVADDDGRLRSVIRSLEAEISAGGGGGGGDEAMLLDSVHRHEDCEDCRMDDILAGVDSHGSCSTSAAAAMAHVEDLEEPFGWVEMVAAAAAEEESPCGGDDMADWYVDECIDALMGAGYGELRGQQYAASVDEQFCSLWDL